MQSKEEKKTLFSLLLFSSIQFQAAVQHYRSLLQATPTPTEPTGWSSTLQSKEPTAWSRQLHKKQLASNTSEKNRKQIVELPECVALAPNEIYVWSIVLFPTL